MMSNLILYLYILVCSLDVHGFLLLIDHWVLTFVICYCASIFHFVHDDGFNQSFRFTSLSLSPFFPAVVCACDNLFGFQLI